MSNEPENYYRNEGLSDTRGCFVGTTYQGVGYGPIYGEYDEGLKFKTIRVSPMTRVIIYNDKHYNGVGTVYDNNSLTVMNLDIDTLLRTGEIDKAVSYKLIVISHPQEINYYLFIFIITFLFAILTWGIIITISDCNTTSKSL